MRARRTSNIRTVSFHTLGCKLNQAESDALAALFSHRGYQVVPFRQPADLTVINTCTVTGEADAKSRQVIRRAVEAAPMGKIVVVGCYPQVNSDEVAGLEGVDMILGTREKHRLPDLLERLNSEKQDEPLVMISDLGATETWDESPFIAAGTRGRVQTALGAWLQFRVTGWEPDVFWAWSVADIPATGHRVTLISATTCQGSMLPLWELPSPHRPVHATPSLEHAKSYLEKLRCNAMQCNSAH